MYFQWSAWATRENHLADAAQGMEIIWKREKYEIVFGKRTKTFHHIIESHPMLLFRNLPKLLKILVDIWFVGVFQVSRRMWFSFDFTCQILIHHHHVQELSKGMRARKILREKYNFSNYNQRSKLWFCFSLTYCVKLSISNLEWKKKNFQGVFLFSAACSFLQIDAISPVTKSRIGAEPRS